MNRKVFLKTSISGAILPWLINSLPMKSLGAGILESAAINSSKTDKILVLIQLDGGNDGLNTIIPLDQYKNLMAARSNILIPEKEVLSLKGSAVTGFHPAMPELQGLYNEGAVTIIQGVSYPNPVFSHFRATDIWMTGSDTATTLDSGVIGRFLDKEFPRFPIGYPSANQPHPPSIQVGSSLSKILQGPKVGMGMVVGGTSDFYDLVLANYDASPQTPAGNGLDYIRVNAQMTYQYTAVIKAAVSAQKNLSKMYPPPTENPLADQLKIVAQLIGGGLQTKIYVVSVDGYDTHGAQVNPNNPMKGRHANLLSNLSSAIQVFEDDLRLMGKQDQVVGMAFSEFGRRIKSNNSFGTDHGSSGPVILFGTSLKGGLIGKNPEIPAAVSVKDNLPMQHDFRAVYSSVLKGWLGVSDQTLQVAVPGSYSMLDLFKA